MRNLLEWSLYAFCILLIISLPVGWLTHVITCLATGAWGFLVAGAIFFPVGWIHGLGILFGIF